MARARTGSSLVVYINARRVGILTRGSDGAIGFAYEAEWLDWPNAFPVSLSLPLRTRPYRGAPVSAVFDNLLPDNEAIRTRIAERMRAEGTDAYSLLAAIGGDCVGALQLLPEDMPPGPAGIVDGELLDDDDVAEIVTGLGRAPLGLDRDHDFRISIAGAQEKTALLRRDGKWYRPNGTTATTHILKPAIGKIETAAGTIDLTDSVENEHVCLRLLAAFGLQVASTEVATFGTRRVLVVERFDREWTADGRLLRRPQEDMCQALGVPPVRKYESEGGPGIAAIAKLLRGADDPAADILAFVKAQILFWAIGATDGHAKNFSIFLYPGGGFRLTPFYDVLTAQLAADARTIPRNRFKLAMAVGTNRHYRIADIHGRHFSETARSIGIGADETRSLIEQIIDNGVAACDAVAAELPKGFPGETLDAIRKALPTRLMALRTALAE